MPEAFRAILAAALESAAREESRSLRMIGRQDLESGFERSDSKQERRVNAIVTLRCRRWTAWPLGQPRCPFLCLAPFSVNTQNLSKAQAAARFDIWAYEGPGLNERYSH